MKSTLLAIFVLTVAVVIQAQLQQPAKPQEPVPHSEQHSPGNPPPPVAGAPQPSNTNSTSGLGGNTLTNQVPKPENSPKNEPNPTAEAKPKAEPPADHDHEHDHEHSPGNPKHLDHMGGGGGNVRSMLLITAVAPIVLTMLAL